METKPKQEARALLDSLLTGLVSGNWSELAPHLATNVQFVDSMGKRWSGHDEMERHFEALFVPYAKRNVTHILESFDIGATDMFIASVLWENVTVSTEPRRSMQRMTLVVGRDGEDWAISFLQVTPIKIP